MTPEEILIAHARLEAVNHHIRKAEKTLNSLKGGPNIHVQQKKALNRKLTRLHRLVELIEPTILNTIWYRPQGLPLILYNNAVVREVPMHELHTVYSEHHRLETFAHKGLKCAWPGCTLEGTILIETVGIAGDLHVDLYTKNFVMMTVDHIVARSKGGADALANKQPMCCRHNWDKGSKPMPIN